MSDANRVAGEVVAYEVQLPKLTVGAHEPYPYGHILKLEVEVRVRGVAFEEAKDGGLVRIHRLSIEDVEVVDAYPPSQDHGTVTGSLAGMNGRPEELEPLTVPF